MLILDEAATRAALPWGPLISGLQSAFEVGCEMPVRHHHTIAVPGEADGTLLLMPAWIPGQHLGVKMVTVIPGNSERGLPAIAGTYILSSARTGEVLALMHGAELTARRTAAASALAASYLARPDAARLLIVGAGKLALNLIEAHATVRPITSVSVWARRPEQAAEVVAEARRQGFDATVAAELGPAVRAADIISCCTLAKSPLVHGDWLSPGSHLDLVGAFTPQMRESDDVAVRRASVFVDTRAGATAEGGDIVQPLRAGVIGMDHIRADLYDLCRRTHPGRRDGAEITLFKSVGAALEDLAAAQIAYARSQTA